jgi:hypothetical protein
MRPLRGDNDPRPRIHAGIYALVRWIMEYKDLIVARDNNVGINLMSKFNRSGALIT